MEDYERKNNKLEQNGIERKKKEEIKECQLKIMKNTHFKNRRPYIRCFWCHILGHTKATCHMKMSECFYHMVKEDCARKEMKMEQNQEKRVEKKEQKEYEQKILKLRSKELNSKLELKEGKGEVHFLQ